MGLGSALQIGKSGLLASQVGVEVTGNNLANAATRGYHRQVVHLTPINNQEIQQGIFVGRGVQVADISRQIDAALEGRLRGAISNQSGSQVSSDILSQIEALENELSDTDLSSRLSDFFNSLSELANNPQDLSLRSLVVQQATRVTDYVQELRSGFVDLRNQTDQAIDAAAVSANDLLSQIEALNAQIVTASTSGGSGSGGLRDQRDQLLSQLSEYLDISVNEQASGALDVFVGSLPIILNSQSRGLEVRKTANSDGTLDLALVLKADGSVVDTSKGQIGALVAARNEHIKGAIDDIDNFAGNLIYEFNKAHSQGQGLIGFDSVTGGYRVKDTSVALNDSATGLDFVPTHGSFKITVTDKATGLSTTSTVNIDLDGINPGSDTSLTSLVADLNGIANVSASITSDGRLKIDAGSSAVGLTFSDDTSGVLAALGVNTFFSGTNAQDIGVSGTLLGNPNYLAAARGHNLQGNDGALALAGLRDQPLASLGGKSITELWQSHVTDYAVRLGQANSRVTSDGVVRQNLEAQQQSISGVNTDEESINLLAFQRAYQGSARFLQVVNELYQTVLDLI
ncbi:MAG: flagellar hook-associated protein FlgK [Phycisphaera sp.]|nr:flagellar hook-associated protein FlgK [Phycisphaera sp.]